MKGAITGFLVLAVVLTLGGCQRESVNTATGPEGSGSMLGAIVVRLMDAPAAYDSVNIVVDSVRVHVESADSVGGWITVSRSPAVYNLLDYTSGRDTVIAEAPVPAGYYSQLRLYIGSGSNVVVSGMRHPLEVPSGSQSGLKLNIQAAIAPGVKYVAALDFDAARSIVVTGNGRYMLKPVIKVVTTAVSGSLSGMVSPDTTHATVWAIAGTDTSSTLADTTGYFKFPFLVPGGYSLQIVPADTTYADTTLSNVSVFAAQNTDVGTIVLRKK